MLKNNILVIALVLILSACASEKPVLTGVDGSAIPPAFAHFPDVPFPDQSYIDLEETKALGTGDNWIGSLVFTTPYNATEMERNCNGSGGHQPYDLRAGESRRADSDSFRRFGQGQSNDYGNSESECFKLLIKGASNAV